MGKHRRKVMYIGDLSVQVTRKPHMKNLRLRVKAPAGQVEVSCPYYVSDADIRDFVLERQSFIVKAQARVRQRVAEQQAAPQANLLQSGQVIELLDKAYLIDLRPLPPGSRASFTIQKRGEWVGSESVTTQDSDVYKKAGVIPNLVGPDSVTTQDSDVYKKAGVIPNLVGPDSVTTQDWSYLLILKLPPEADWQQQDELMQEVYRQILQSQLEEYVVRAEARTGLQAKEYRLKKMKTRWGTCNPAAQRIWLSTKLAAYPGQCLEYILVHELVHLLEKGHGPRFQALLDQFYPAWREAERLLNGVNSKYRQVSTNEIPAAQ